MQEQNTLGAATAATDTATGDAATADPQGAGAAVGTLAVQAQVAAGCQIYPPTSFQVCGAIRDKYNQMGGPTSFLLLPKSNELTNPGNTGKRSEFIGGNIYWSAATGAHPVAHEFLFKWGDHGYERGFLKYPTTDEIVLAVDGISRRQQFQGGHIYWSPATGAHSIQGLIYDKWKAFGAETGVLKFPTSDEIVAPDGKGRFTTFQGGAIYWHPTTGAHPVYGPLHLFWAHFGYEAGTFGYPTGDPVYTGDNISQEFQRGTLRLWNGNLEAIHPVDNDDVILDSDTDPHPEYTDRLNFDNYGITADPDGSKTETNIMYAKEIAVAFHFKGELQAESLWNRMYQNTGGWYTIPVAVLDEWMEDTTQGYTEEPRPIPPATTRAANRDRAVALAIETADRTGKPYKAIVTSDHWVPTAGNNNDHVHSLGRYSLAATTAVIAKPGAPGQHQIQLVQQAHIQDDYDFARGNGGADPDAEWAVGIAVDGFELGIAKWFRVYGDGSKTAWSGLR